MSLAIPADLASYLAAAAVAAPHQAAVISPSRRGPNGRACHTQLTYRELDDESTVLARGLVRAGLRPGMRVVFLVKPGLEFFALSFAVFKAGAVLVAVDPGMGPRNVARCLAETEPDAFIGVSEAHTARRIFGWGRRSIRLKVLVGRPGLLGWGLTPLAALYRLGADAPPVEPTSTPDDAAIVFTSGSTGPPKGVLYSHGLVIEQARMLAETFQMQPGDRELITFPHFAFFGPVWRATLVVADMDFLQPAKANPERILEVIHDHGVTGMFGSPALLNRLGIWGERTGMTLPSLRRVVSAGAPVSARVIRRMTSMLRPGVQVHTPYGATEALPVSCIASDELLAETAALTDRGAGVCVGRPLSGVDVRIIRITDDPLESWSDAWLAPAGEVGEIVARGPVVTTAYFRRPEATRASKIYDGDGGVYHRMGDLGYFDEQGRLWYCGRKSQRVVTPERDYFTTPCEGVFNTLPEVFRTALVGVDRGGSVRPVLCVELEAGVGVDRQKTLREDLLRIAAAFDHTRNIRDILFHPGFPVDPRHNTKIGREKLGRWAHKQRLARS